MREMLTKAKLWLFLERLGASARTEGTCFLTGGASALLEGWRETTIDVDLRLDPEPAGVFEAIPQLKRELAINIELASPADFLPPLPGWRERSRFVGQFGKLQVLQYDFIAQALSKVERGHDKDLADANEMLRRGLVTEAELRHHAEAIRPQLPRYPAIDETAFLGRVQDFLKRRQRV
jgi:hypothetical protein